MLKEYQSSPLAECESGCDFLTAVVAPLYQSIAFEMKKNADHVGGL
jgi:hypothetical protein